jgi:hypothetical protein
VKGLSGAVITNKRDGTVTKTGGLVDRTIEQGEWILRHGGDAFPKNVEILEDGYRMERLDFIEYFDVGSDFSIDTLRQSVWSQPAVVPPTRETVRLLQEKMMHTFDKHLAGTLGQSEKVAILEDATHAGNGAYRLRHCLTHGDPTAENIMVRPGYGKVFIDPIRATEVVPDSPAVDVGKVLQSAYGWEDAKYGTGIMAYKPSDIKQALNDDELFAVGESWAVVHVMRAIPYIGRIMPDSMDKVVTVLNKAIAREL